MEQASAPQFAAVAQIGKGPFPLTASRGAVIVESGKLTMRGRNGEVIVSDVALSEIRARPQRLSWGNAVRMWAGESSYLLKWHPKSGVGEGSAGVAAGLAVTGAGVAGRVAAGMPKQRVITKEFLALVESQGGKLL